RAGPRRARRFAAPLRRGQRPVVQESRRVRDRVRRARPGPGQAPLVAATRRAARDAALQEGKGRMSTFTSYGQRANLYPGKLVIVEGIDGSGKSTQLSLLAEWLRSEGHLVTFSEWNSSPIVKATTARGKKRQLLTPLTFSLIHATDFSDRVERDIVPALKAGAIVLADRYVYTAFARDVARGVDGRWVRSLYRFAVTPTLAVYYRVPLDVALYRILSSRPKLKFYEAGMDLQLSPDPTESYRQFQGRIQGEYESLVPEYRLAVMDATLPIEVQQRALRALVAPHLRGIATTPREIEEPGEELRA